MLRVFGQRAKGAEKWNEKSIAVALALLLAMIPQLAFGGAAEGQNLQSFGASTATVMAWGWNGHGGLGDDTRNDRWAAVQTLGPFGQGFLQDVTQVVAGMGFTIALSSDGAVWGWGKNDLGQLGNGKPGDVLTPAPVLDPSGKAQLRDVKSIAAGSYNAFAISKDGTVLAWGDNRYGELGDGTNFRRYLPVSVVGEKGLGRLGDIAQVAAGSDHTVALRNNGETLAWGRNYYGQLGDGTTTDSWNPIRVKGVGGSGSLTGISEVAAGPQYTLALKQDGTVASWGAGWAGRLGTGDTLDRKTPVLVKSAEGSGSLVEVTQVSAGNGHSFAVSNDGSIWAWGSNQNGKLGVGDTADRYLPSRVVGQDGVGALGAVRAVAAGAAHSVALLDGGTLLSWGANGNGQVGDGTRIDRSAPIPVISADGLAPISSVVDLAAGGLHSVAIRQLNPPQPPQNLTVVSGPGANEISLSWTPPTSTGTGDLLSYRIYRTIDANRPLELRQHVDGSRRTFHDGGLFANTTYYYRVSAVSDHGESYLSIWASGRTFTLPTAPEAVTADPGERLAEVLIQWEIPLSDGGSQIDAYTIYRSREPGAGFAALATVQGDRQEYVDEGVPGRTYYYHIAAINVVGEGPFSSADCTRPSPWISQFSLGPGCGGSSI